MLQIRSIRPASTEGKRFSQFPGGPPCLEGSPADSELCLAQMRLQRVLLLSLYFLLKIFEDNIRNRFTIEELVSSKISFNKNN
jgi:hypothetical protein